MAKIEAKDKMVLEKLFQMESGYVLDFNDNTMYEFFIEEFNINIRDEKYDFEYPSKSKANRLRGVWRAERAGLVGHIISSLIQRIETKAFLEASDPEENLESLIEYGRDIAIKIYTSDKDWNENQSLDEQREISKSKVLELQDEFISLYGISHLVIITSNGNEVREELFFIKRLIEYIQKSIEIFIQFEHQYMDDKAFDKVNYFYKIIAIKIKDISKGKPYSFLKETKFIFNDEFKIKELIGNTKKFKKHKEIILSDFKMIYSEIDELCILNKCTFEMMEDTNEFLKLAIKELNKTIEYVWEEIEEFNNPKPSEFEEKNEEIWKKFEEKNEEGNKQKIEPKKEIKKISIKMTKNGSSGYLLLLQGNKELQVKNKSMWNDLYKFIYNHPKELTKGEYSNDFVSNLNKQTNGLQKAITKILGEKIKILKLNNEKVILRNRVKIDKS